MSKVTKQNPVAYFCAEYGFDSDLPLYAGGLGILAGDTVKEAADQRLPMVALGLLYRGCNAKQIVGEDGLQKEEDIQVDPVAAGFEHVYLPDSDQPLFVKTHLTRVDVWARVWQKKIGQTTLYLLDTDTDQNEPDERGIACAIYDGSDDYLLKQQMVLGIGGVKVLDALQIKPSVYHVNEGRPAFLYWQLIRRFMDNDKLSYEEAVEKAKSMIVYTNHTLVRAGNNAYDMELLKSYALYYAEKMGVTINELLEPGIDESNDAFSMTEFALNTSRKASAVSQIHHDLCKNVWPEYDWSGITNGVHLPTWQDPEIRDVDLETDNLWWIHKKKKQELARFVRAQTGYGYNPDTLTIGWARRIAGYKRPQAVFEDIDRLKKILKQADRPVTILMSGRAHVRDSSAKNTLKEIISLMQNELAGHALYIPNYNIEVAMHMIRGVDVWLNTPVLGMEASGTSGMKATANGVLQVTVEDGWAAEVEWNGIGWTLDSNHLSPTLYMRLEKDIVPIYYNRDENDVPKEWLAMMKKTVKLAEQFSTTRMLSQYIDALYN